MAKYRISNRVSGYIIGVYEGTTAEEALDALASDAGYDSASEMGEVSGNGNVDLEIIVEVAEHDGEVTLHGRPVSYAAAVNLMDDEIRESLHSEIAPCSDQEFLDAYVEAHAGKFGGEEFRVE